MFAVCAIVIVVTVAQYHKVAGRLKAKANKPRQITPTPTLTYACSASLLFSLCGRCDIDGNLRSPQEGSS